jgi:hypothetical protein
MGNPKTKVMSLLVVLRSDPERQHLDPIASTSYCHSGWTMLSLLVESFADALPIWDFQNSRRIQADRQSSWA